VKPADESRLVERAQQGDARAFEGLFRAHQVRVHNLVRYIVGDPLQAEDVTQRAFVRAWEELPRLRDAGAFTSWLNRIAANLAKDEVRVRGGRRADDQGAPSELEGVPDETPAAPEALLTAEQAAEVHRAIGTLPEHQREVVLMHHLEGLPVQDVADRLGLALGTVLSRLARGREALRRELAPYVER
jgi:RNA polymerase sigma-70 factor (ECF subfamily)